MITFVAFHREDVTLNPLDQFIWPGAVCRVAIIILAFPFVLFFVGDDMDV